MLIPSGTHTHTLTLCQGAKPLTGKSIWKGANDEDVNVEIFALEQYQSEGYKGFVALIPTLCLADLSYPRLHSEGRVLTTLFALLFFDIIFTPIPGAFETPYQVAPLDIGSDTFYLARRDLIDARLDEIAAGHAPEIGLATWDRESAAKTWCVGLRWDLLTREDWEEILAYWEPAALALVCRTLAEDFVNRTSGVPDLFLWHGGKRECKFVEVKGPGDHLQENQKVSRSSMAASTRAHSTMTAVDGGVSPSESQCRGLSRRGPGSSKDRPQAQGASKVGEKSQHTQAQDAS